MKNYSDFYATSTALPRSYFIGSNTKSGFAPNVSPYFSENDLTKLFIIKGGPGTGKSTMMKNAATEAERLGASVTRLYCSSDPDSLDGIIIDAGNVRIGITDGTSPHTLDAHYPGACGEIVNCGDCWNTAALEEARDTIAALSARKALAFTRCYEYLGAADKVMAALRRGAAAYTDEKKLRAFVRRLIKRLPTAEGETHYCITKAISMKGAVRLDTFDHSETLIAIEDFAFIAPAFFNVLAAELAGKSCIISRSPMGEICEILLPEASIAFVPYREDAVYSKIIRMKRFVSADDAKEVRSRRRFNERCLVDILGAATESLSEARVYHFELEEIYKAAMDFTVLNKVGSELYEKIAKLAR